MKLYYFPGACSLADHIVLKWAGVPHEAVRMSREDTKTPQYLAINPTGTVPALVDEAFVLSENVAILAYLADRFPDAGLWGDGSERSRADTLRWAAYLNSDVHGAFKPLFSPWRFVSDETQFEDVAERARERVREHFRFLEARMQGRQWVTGQRSIADPYLFVMLRWALRKDISLDEFPNLRRFLEHMFADAGAFAAIAEEEDALE